MTIDFTKSERSTIGIEWELAIVDKDSKKLIPIWQNIRTRVDNEHPDVAPNFHSELMSNTVEVVTGVHKTVGSAVDELNHLCVVAKDLVESEGGKIFTAGTHPFDDPLNQQINSSPYYKKILSRARIWMHSMLIWGQHIHVGIEDKNKVLPIWHAMLAECGLLLATSTSSPFWNNTSTGYASNRSLYFAQLPTAGIGYQFNEWSEFENCVEGLMNSNSITSFGELWWDIRPAVHYGTLEIRVLDSQTNIYDIARLTALIQCMVEYFSTLIDEGKQDELPKLEGWFVRQNKWRASRYGLNAKLIVNNDAREQNARDHLRELLVKLRPIASKLGCSKEIAELYDFANEGMTSAARQLEVAKNFMPEVNFNQTIGVPLTETAGKMVTQSLIDEFEISLW
ncbi:MAG: YbdK family carboxylate-amine ligase [Bifidobacteriaceae bacterium]|nr:YbdK family carboxylate-amine ligase [Bifidobacteriaceae bacterium]